MGKATITIHLPAHRRASLASEQDTRAAAQAYDQNIGPYMAFLQTEARNAGFVLRTSHIDARPVLRIDECSHEDKKDAFRWLERQPDIWDWMPEAVVS